MHSTASHFAKLSIPPRHAVRRGSAGRIVSRGKTCLRFAARKDGDGLPFQSPRMPRPLYTYSVSAAAYASIATPTPFSLKASATVVMARIEPGFSLPRLRTVS